MNWTLKRIIETILELYIAITLTFFLTKYMPGNPIYNLIISYLMQGYTYVQAVQMASTLIGYNVTTPIWVQYVQYIKGVFTGHLGVSLYYHVPVATMIGIGLPWTLFLVITSLLLAYISGVFLGILLGMSKGKRREGPLNVTFSVLSGIPNYIVAVLLWIFLTYRIHLFPTAGNYATSAGTPSLTNFAFIESVLYHYTLPIISFWITLMPGWILAMKSSVISVLKDDYVTVARARGIRGSRLTWTYIGKNAMLPIITGLPIAFAGLIGGAVFIENIFSLLGAGFYMYQAIGGRDYPLALGFFLMLLMIVILGNLIMDLTYQFIDPRVKMR